MKTKLFIGSALLILLAGCSADEPTTETSESTATAESETENTLRFTPQIWVDKESGCHYLIVETGINNGGVAITPRMAPNHTQMCDE